MSLDDINTSLRNIAYSVGKLSIRGKEDLSVALGVIQLAEQCSLELEKIIKESRKEVMNIDGEH